MVSFHSFDCMWHVAIWHVGGIPCCASYVDASLGGKCLGKCSFCYIFSIFSIKFKSTDFTSAIYFLYISHFYLEQLQQYKQIFNTHSNAVKKNEFPGMGCWMLYLFSPVHKFYNEYRVEAHKQMFKDFRRKNVNEKEKNEIL